MKLVVKDNSLINASYSLGLVEQRIMLLAIVEARETGQGIDTDTFLEVHAQHYADRFDINVNNAYSMLSEATQTLFNRQVTYTVHDEKRNKPEKRVVRWVSGISYVEGAGVVKLRFAPEVVPLITRLEKNFTSYELEQVKNLNTYATRLYEILASWRSIGKVTITLEELRNNLGLIDEYSRLEAFKRRVLDLAVSQINEHTNIKAQYEQHKNGRVITGFTFKFKMKKTKEKISAKVEVDRIEMSTIEGLNDKQLGRIARNPSFIADYNHLVSSTSPAGQDTRAWELEMINRLKKDSSQFKKRPIRDYLEY
ncbi:MULTISPECIES: replication initiation protein RepM [unclassified Psychrobacter]|jgi:plasmid replication initiation protein|uniref:replication initiation protein RepM n=1 Tax=Psychrobacter TaxID=497 RepID=UPI000C7B227E|nr:MULTISPECIES: replication initiation protein RepM [unclassified Psychrobacter]PLT23724.1 initiator RepB protein [Psychrobacter sp. MES7-P7E]TEW80239.1 RepB family plasmid replication initiator protein [Psychrobacter sp. 230]|tara:strand:- start:1565 stop:2494 length:930 start_codon:yes stop_codon:yes gene_type:complete